MPSILLHRRVVGPTFSSSVRRLDFGKVSYGFLYKKTLDIENKSEIPFDYKISLSHNGRFQRREASISLQVGTINKYATQTIKIEFIPETQQNYELELYVDVDKFQEKMITIPISAECIAPPVKIVSDKIDLGNVFIGAPYEGKYEYIAHE